MGSDLVVLSNEKSLLLYIFCFLTVCFAGFVFQRSKTKSGSFFPLAIIWLILTLVVGLRVNVGADYAEYVSAFENDWYSRYGLFSQLLFFIARFTTGDAQTVFFLFSAVSNLFLVLILLHLKKREIDTNIPLLLSIYLFLFFPLSLNIMRQGLAAIILVYGTLLLIDKKNIPAFALFILAFLTHNSAIFFLLFAVIYKISKPEHLQRNIFIVVASLAFVMLTGIMKFLPIVGNYAHYLEAFSLKNIDWMLFLSYVPMLLLLLVKKDKSDLGELFLRALFVTGVIFEVLFSSTFASRIGIYLSMMSMILLPSLINRIQDKKQKTALTTVGYIFCVTYFVAVFYFHGRACIFPYNFAPLW